MGRNKASAALAVAAALALSSCIGIETRVSFKDDGSGVLRVEYRIAKSLLEPAAQSGSSLPLPEEQEVRDALSAAPGLRLVSLDRRDDDKDVFLSAEIAFDSVDALRGVEALSDMPMSLERSGGDFVFSQVVLARDEEQPGAAGEGPAAPAPGAGPGAAAESDSEIAQMFGGLFEGYEITLAVTAPRPVKSHSAGDLSLDRRSVTWTLPVQSAMELPQGTVLTVTW
jgi:hypothetical protein